MTPAAFAASPFRNPSATGRTALITADPHTAIRIYRAAAQAEPSDFESRYWLYSALMASGQQQQARQVLDQARDLQTAAVMRKAGVELARLQSDPNYAFTVAEAFCSADMMGPASLALRCSLDLNNLSLTRLVDYGLSLRHQGRVDEAIDIFTAAAARFPRADVHSLLIDALFHAPDRPRRVSEEARRSAALHAPQIADPPVFTNARTTARRLRVGYIGPGFTHNPLARLLPPVLEAHDQDAIEVVLYCDNPEAEVGLPIWMQMRAVGGLPHDLVAEQVRQDGIDILIDVWGHVAGGRLPVFAHRPAPVQIAWLNFGQTTGLACMDYVLHADSMDRPGAELFFTEKIWPIGPIVSPYRPAAGRPEPAPTPALGNGHVTFGAFIAPVRLSDATVAAWAKILAARPADRLVLKHHYFVDPVLQRVTEARFAAHGAAPEQLEFRGHTDGPDTWREFHDIDLALAPCPGDASSCDALAAGAPVLTRWGDDIYAGGGAAVAAACGLPELIADDWDDYVSKALALTEDFAALDALRARVPARLRRLALSRRGRLHPQARVRLPHDVRPLDRGFGIGVVGAAAASLVSAPGRGATRPRSGTARPRSCRS